MNKPLETLNNRLYEINEQQKDLHRNIKTVESLVNLLGERLFPIRSADKKDKLGADAMELTAPMAVMLQHENIQLENIRDNLERIISTLEISPVENELISDFDTSKTKD